MFKSKIEVCPKTGIASFSLQFNVGNGNRSHQGGFLTTQDAEKYILSCKISYILITFSKYVSHAHILLEKGSREFYAKTSKMEALDRCMKYNEYLADKPLGLICYTLIRLEEDMRKILPSPSNPSYHSSSDRIAGMMVFCREELTNHPEFLKKLQNDKKPACC